MAFEIGTHNDFPYQASSNVSAITWTGNPPVYSSGGIPQYYGVVYDTGTGNESDVKLAGANAAIIGVAQDAPAVTAGGAVRVRTQGITRMIAGGAVTVGALLATDSSGRAVTAPSAGATDSPVIGVAETAATGAGDVLSVRLTPGAMTTVNA